LPCLYGSRRHDGLGFPDPGGAAVGADGVGAFFWSLRNGQFEDLDGAAARILIDDEELPAEKLVDRG
jgi:cbb3-type cytochrome oxidase maturation protein